jgi:peptide/nickel transport system permease protein
MNKVLTTGIILCTFFLLLALIGPLLAPYPVDYDEKILSVEGETPGEYEVLVAPHPPGPLHLFGTDPWGYDLLTLMLYGVRFTVFLSIGIALLRIIACIPIFLPIYFILYNVFLNPPISIFTYTLLQSLLLCILGIPAVYPVVREKIRITASLPFITAARSMGTGLLGQYRSYIMKPHEWWLILFPLIGYCAVLLSYYILSKGITRYVSKRHHVY